MWLGLEESIIAWLKISVVVLTCDIQQGLFKIFLCDVEIYTSKLKLEASHKLILVGSITVHPVIAGCYLWELTEKTKVSKYIN